MADRLKLFINGEWIESKTDKVLPVTNPSSGETMAEAPLCTMEEVEAAVGAAKAAFPAWSETPAVERAQAMFRLKALLDEQLEEVAHLLSSENGKTLPEARGSVQRGIEIVEFACGAPTLMMGECLPNVTAGFDTMRWRVPLGVFAGIVPFNFPAMIPMWMFPLAIATGNTFVLKAATKVPQCALRLAEMMREAGLPKGVLNVVTCTRNEVDRLLKHPDIRGISFVGSTGVGRHVYATAAAHGKRVQCLTEAKNHALVMPDCVPEATARGIINGAFGCAGERCMALPAVVVLEEIADALVEKLVAYGSALKVGPATAAETEMGPVIDADHRDAVEKYIESGVREGAKLILDGRGASVAGYENGSYLGPTIFDHVTNEMKIGVEEIFGPVLCVKRVKDFEEGLALINSSEFGNGSAIYTQDGRSAREFTRRVQAGMVGVNVGIPVPLGFFPFAGWKHSFFGDLHCLGRDGVAFYTETKCVTSRWFDPGAEAGKAQTWD